MSDIREQIDRLRNSRAVWKDARGAPTDLEEEAADTLEKLLARNELLEAVVETIQSFINAQAEDEGLWCEAQYASEAYIQRALRGCHAYIESVVKDGPRPKFTVLVSQKKIGNVDI